MCILDDKQRYASPHVTQDGSWSLCGGVGGSVDRSVIPVSSLCALGCQVMSNWVAGCMHSSEEPMDVEDRKPN